MRAYRPVVVACSALRAQSNMAQPTHLVMATPETPATLHSWPRLRMRLSTTTEQNASVGACLVSIGRRAVCTVGVDSVLSNGRCHGLGLPPST